MCQTDLNVKWNFQFIFQSIIVFFSLVEIPPTGLPLLCYTFRRREAMKYKRESYPDRIRRIAEDLSQMRNLYEADRSAEKLRMIADELEQNIKKSLSKKP